MRREMTTNEAQLLLFAICNEFDQQKCNGDTERSSVRDGGQAGGDTGGGSSARDGVLVGVNVGVKEMASSGSGDDEDVDTVPITGLGTRNKTKVCAVS